MPVRWCYNENHIPSVSAPQTENHRVDPLEGIRLSLPLSTNLHSDLYASVDFFRTSLIINAELEDVTVLELECTRFDASVRESHMVEESA